MLGIVFELTSLFAREVVRGGARGPACIRPGRRALAGAGLAGTAGL